MTHQLKSTIYNRPTYSQHQPVLLQEILEYLDPKYGEIFIDGTFGFGGHGLSILDKVGVKGKVIGIEADDEILEKFKSNHQQLDNSNLILFSGNYADMDSIVKKHDINQVDGVLLDLGYNSYHVDQSLKGFSFKEDQVLDMRYNRVQNEEWKVKSNTQTAAEIINSYPEKELYRFIRDYGEERYAGRIAKAIVNSRKRGKILTTSQFVEVIRSAVPARYIYGRIHYATRTFQALRIEVNDELNTVELGLQSTIKILRGGGKIGVITFHSLEDRIVKHFFRDSKELEVLTKKPIVASREEVRDNPRARSAKLRIAKRI